MEENKFQIIYKEQNLQIEPKQDANQETFYHVTFPDQEQIDIYVTPATDGLAPNWAEGKGENSARANEIGDLIVDHEE